MGKIKIAKRIDFLVTLKTEERGDEIVQTYEFWTHNKRYLKFAYDQRYCLKRKLEKIYEENLLDNFLAREEGEARIVFRYKKTEDFKAVPAKTFNCEFYMPPFNGCKYCMKCKTEGDFVYCEEKQKHYDSGGIKNCQVFQSIDEILT